MTSICEERILSDLQEIKINLHLLVHSNAEKDSQSSLHFTNPVEEISALFA